MRQILYPEAQNSNVMSTPDSQKANTKQNNDRKAGPAVIIRGNTVYITWLEGLLLLSKQVCHRVECGKCHYSIVAGSLQLH